jgi:hypothetical protein
MPDSGSITVVFLRRIAVLAILVNAFWSSPVFARKPKPIPNADSIHWAAWDSVLNRADDMPAVRYSFYAYRTLAVPNPEIYLKSDAFFSDLVASIPGSRAAFHDRNPRNLDLYQRLQRGEVKGPPFTWDGWSLTLGSVSDSSIGTRGNSWLDRRLPSAGVLLRSALPQLTTLEASAMLYTQMRRTGRPDSALFVVVDTSGRGYLADGDNIISAQTALPWEGDLAVIAPVLVFNERVVFYPLFGRDDRVSDPTLGRLVGRLGSPGLPALTLLDRIRLQKLQIAAALPTQQARDWTVLAACGAVGMYNSALQKAWVSCAGGTGTAGAAQEPAMVRTTMYWADMLSRPVAQLAALADTSDFAALAARWQERYLQLCGRPVTINGRKMAPERLEAWGNLWSNELIDIPFDDIIRTRAGQGSSQALAMSAVLDMVGRPYFRLEIDPGEAATPDQHWVITEGERWQFNLGTWTRIPDTLPAQVRFPLLALSYGTGGRWVSFGAGGIETDSDDLMVTDGLTEAARVLRNVTLRFPAQKEYSMSLAELLMKLDAAEIPIRALPWPNVGRAGGRGQ